MKKLLIPLLLFLGISFNCLGQKRLIYCPEARFNTIRINTDIHFLEESALLNNGQYLVDFRSPSSSLNLYGVLDALAENKYCTKSEIIIDLIYKYPTELKNKVIKANLQRGFFLDSAGGAWFLSKNSNMQFNAFNKLKPQDADEYFITFFNNTFLSNKSRLYKTDGTFINIEFDPKIDVLSMQEFDNLIFYNGDSFLTKYTEINGQYIATSNISFPVFPFKYISPEQKIVANTHEIYTLTNTFWNKSFVLDTQKFKNFIIHRPSINYIQIANTDTGGYAIINYQNEYAVFENSNHFYKKATIPDTLYKNYNGEYTAIIGNKLHETVSNYYEKYHAIAKIKSLQTTAINKDYFALEKDSVYKLDLATKKWNAILSKDSAQHIDYDQKGNLVLYNNNTLQLINTQNLAIEKANKSVKGQTKNAKWYNHQFWLIETDSTIEIYNSQNEKWISIKNISNIKTAIIDSTQIFCVDNEGFKYATFSTESAELLSVKYPIGAEQINFRELKTPIITKIIGYDSLFIFTNGHETNNFAFVLNPTSKEVSIQKYWPYMFDDSRISFFDYGSFSSVLLPFKIKNIAYNSLSITVLTDMGFVMFDCKGSTTEIAENTIDFYPNPASENIIFSEKADYIIYDINGRQILAQKSVLNADISCLPKGFYVIELRTNQAHSVAKLLKN